MTFEDIRPGDMLGQHAAFLGEFVTISAEVRGLADDEPVLLYYSTADGQIARQAVPMTLPKNAYRHQCRLPADDGGLQQGFDYYLTAGDCRTKHFTIEVQTAPAITVEAVEYDYPSYTGIADRVAAREGDIRAIEGAQITLRAVANQPIKQAEIDFDCDGLRGQKMTADGNKASGRFTLQFSRDDPSLPEHDSYQLRFTDRAGNLNPRPTRHRIEVIRDLPPEVELVEPQQEEIRLAIDGKLPIRVRAADPDFALARVAVRMDHAGRDMLIPPLLEGSRPGEFQGVYVFEPGRWELREGDRISFWAEADDNKNPQPGHAETTRRWITIVDPDNPQQTGQQPGQGAQSQSPRPEDGQAGQAAESPRETRPADQAQAASGPSEQASPLDKPSPDEEDQSPPDRKDQSPPPEPGAKDQPSDSQGQGDGQSMQQGEGQGAGDQGNHPQASESPTGDPDKSAQPNRQPQPGEKGDSSEAGKPDWTTKRRLFRSRQARSGSVGPIR